MNKKNKISYRSRSSKPIKMLCENFASPMNQRELIKAGNSSSEYFFIDFILLILLLRVSSPRMTQKRCLPNNNRKRLLMNRKSCYWIKLEINAALGLHDNCRQSSCWCNVYGLGNCIIDGFHIFWNNHSSLWHSHLSPHLNDAKHGKHSSWR